MDMVAIKLAVSVPKDLFDKVERKRKKRGLTRSAVVQVGLQAWLDALHEYDRVQKYIRGYEKYPETEDELAMSTAIFQATIKKGRRR